VQLYNISDTPREYVLQLYILILLRPVTCDQNYIVLILNSKSLHVVDTTLPLGYYSSDRLTTAHNLTNALSVRRVDQGQSTVVTGAPRLQNIIEPNRGRLPESNTN